MFSQIVRVDQPTTGELSPNFAAYLAEFFTVKDGYWGLFIVSGHSVFIHIPLSEFEDLKPQLEFIPEYYIDDSPAYCITGPDEVTHKAMGMAQQALQRVIPGVTARVWWSPSVKTWLTSNHKWVPPKMDFVPLWRPCVPFSEIRIWQHQLCEILGFWNGKPVDIWWAYDDRAWVAMINNMTIHYRLHKMGLESYIAFPQIAFLTDENGHIFGYMTEPSDGRRPTKRDVSLLYATNAHLLSLGVGLTEWDERTLIVDDGTVKTSSINGIRFADPSSPEFPALKAKCLGYLNDFARGDIVTRRGPTYAWFGETHRKYKHPHYLLPIRFASPRTLYLGYPKDLEVFLKLLPDFKVTTVGGDPASYDDEGREGEGKDGKKRRRKVRRTVQIDTPAAVDRLRQIAKMYHLAATQGSGGSGSRTRVITLPQRRMITGKERE